LLRLVSLIHFIGDITTTLTMVKPGPHIILIPGSRRLGFGPEWFALLGSPCM